MRLLIVSKTRLGVGGSAGGGGGGGEGALCDSGC